MHLPTLIILHCKKTLIYHTKGMLLDQTPKQFYTNDWDLLLVTEAVVYFPLKLVKYVLYINCTEQCSNHSNIAGRRRCR